MWFITHANTDRIVFLKNKTIFGRVGADVELKDDASISRKHAEFNLSNDTLKIQDVGSKYGTFYVSESGEKIKLASQEQKLKNGMKIIFGIMANEWEVHHAPQKTAFSMIAANAKTKLDKVLKELHVGASAVFDNTCTHLTVSPSTAVTHKLLQALSSCTPVVTPNYWVAVQESVNKNEPLPKCIDFAPVVADGEFITPGSVSLLLNNDRQKLFAGKSFIFFSSTQMSSFESVVLNSGGKCISLSRNKLKPKDCSLKNSVVVTPPKTESQTKNEEGIEKVAAELKKANRHMIPEIEIGLAVLYCSTKRWCNPDFQAEKMFEPSQTGLLRVKSSRQLAEDSSDLNKFAVPLKRPRGRPKKGETAKAVEIIDLDDDDDEDVSSIKNKENIPSSTDTQGSLANVEIPETQHEEISQQSALVVEPSEAFNPKYHSSQINEQPATSSRIKKTNLSNFKTRGEAEEMKSQPESSFLDVPSAKQPSRIELSIAPVDLPSSLFNFSDTTTNRSTRSLRNRKNDEVANDSSRADQPSDLFNFTETSTNQSRQSQRKRKNSNSEDESLSSASSVQVAPNRKRTRTNQIESEELPQPTVSKRAGPSRKRAAETPLDDGDNLFNFNVSIKKKSKQTTKSVDEQDAGSSNDIQPSFTRTPGQLMPSYDYSDNSCDSGVWLSKAMIAVKIEDSTDGIKEEIFVPDSQLDSQDFNPGQLQTLFSVLDSSVLSSTSSMVSKRKQFVKKNNFKPQQTVVVMKKLNVVETHVPLDDF